MSAGPGATASGDAAGTGSAGPAGEPVSALVVGNGRDARVLAIGRQLVAPRPGRPFRFAGVLAPARHLAGRPRQALEQAALRLAEHYRLRGLASVDALVAGDAVTVLELNPRPGGSLDAYGAALGVDLFALHVAACRGGALPEPMVADALRGIADRLRRSDDTRAGWFAWPDWAADRSPPGSVIPAGGPDLHRAGAGCRRRSPCCGCCGQRADVDPRRVAVQAAACGKPPLRYDRQVMTFSQAAQ